MKHFTFPALAGLVCLCLQSTRSISQVTIPVGSATRSMILYVPAALPPNRPLIISMHGSGQGADYQQSMAKWEPIADTAKFVVVYPSGINKQWDISGTSDINFINAIIDTMHSRYSIDRNRVYLSGFSMGGMMTYHAATQIANKIAAFAPVSGYPLWGSNYNSSRPIPIIHVHGDADDVVTYNNLGNYLNGWITRNQCPSTPQITQPYPANKPNSIATKRYWGPGAEQSEVVLITLAGKGHWYSIDTVNGVNTSLEIWNFVKRFSLGSIIQENTTGFCSVDGTIDNNYAGYTGTGFMNTSNAIGNGIGLKINFPVAGSKTFTVRYASTDNRPARLLVNGIAVVPNINFISTGSWSNWSVTTFTATVNAGIVTVRLEATGTSGLPNVDYLQVTGGLATGCNAALNTSTTLSAFSSVQPQQEELQAGGLWVYPNPATQSVRIRAGEQWKPGDPISLYNAQGKMLQTWSYKGYGEELNIQSLPAGQYFIRIRNKRSQQTSLSFIKK